MLSPAAEREFVELANSESFRKDMDAVRRNRHNPFVRNGIVDVDAYLDFVAEFNEFINHEPKPFKRIIDRDMRL